MQFKRGLSPVVATSLLVALAVILALIIFLWARTFIGEHLEKEGQSIELACKDVNFDAEIVQVSAGSYKINVVNRGNVPIYGLEIRKKGLGSVDTIKTVGNGAETITAGESAQLDLTGATSGAQYLLVPVLLGESEDYTKPHICDSEYEKEVAVP